jgi:glycosyltransferase involved in cell wall biosynthesis
MKRLRFCLVTTFYPPYHFGGDAIFTYRLAEALAERGHSVHVVHSEDAYRLRHPVDPEIAFTHHPGVERFPLSTRTPMLSAFTAHQLGQPAAYASRLCRHFDTHEYDVVHYHNISLIGGPGVLQYGRGIKLYTTHEYWLICPTHVLFTFDREACIVRKCLRCTLHSRRPPQPWRYTRTLEKSARHVDCFIMPSRFAMEKHRAAGLQGRMTVLPNFVPVPSEEPATGGDGAKRRPFFLFVGRLEKLKGVQDILPIFAECPDASLVIAGSGDYAPALRQQARGLSNVEFLGQVHPSEMRRLYRDAIALLAPSLCYETFSLVAAEAMAHGTPVIGRRIGALAELLDESGGGVAFESRDECRQAMDRLRTEPSLRAALGARGRRTFLEKWTTEVHLERYLALVDGLLDERARSPSAHMYGEPHGKSAS